MIFVHMHNLTPNVYKLDKLAGPTFLFFFFGSSILSSSFIVNFFSFGFTPLLLFLFFYSSFGSTCGPTCTQAILFFSLPHTLLSLSLSLHSSQFTASLAWLSFLFSSLVFFLSFFFLLIPTKMKLLALLHAKILASPIKDNFLH